MRQQTSARQKDTHKITLPLSRHDIV